MVGSDYEIMIAGGGPAGVSTWLHLQKFNPALAARTILIEKSIYPREKLCGGGVTPRADLILGRLGIKIDVPSVPIHNLEFRLEADNINWNEGNAFRVVRRHEFDHELIKVAIDRGLKVKEGETFSNFERIDRKLLIKTSRGEYRIKVLVGADGTNSTVRKKMGIAENPRVSRLISILTPVDPRSTSEFINNKAVLDFGPVTEGLQGYVWDFPCLEKGVPMMNQGIFDSRVHPDHPKASLKTIFSRELQARNAYRESGTWNAFPIRWFSNEGIFSRQNIILVGDAAGVDPIFGEGISQSIEYGDVAAASIVNALDNNDLSFKGYKTRLLNHPLGHSLTINMHFAKKIYQGGPTALKRIHNILTSRQQPTKDI